MTASQVSPSHNLLYHSNLSLTKLGSIITHHPPAFWKNPWDSWDKLGGLCRTSQCWRLFVKQRYHALPSWAILTFLTYCSSKAQCILVPDWFIDILNILVILSFLVTFWLGVFVKMFLQSLSGWRFTWGHWEFGADGDQALWCQHPKFGDGMCGETMFLQVNVWPLKCNKSKWNEVKKLYPLPYFIIWDANLVRQVGGGGPHLVT